MSELTYGQKLVRTDFNPSGDEGVALIKQAMADVIDEICRRKPDLLPPGFSVSEGQYLMSNGPGTRAGRLAVDKLEDAVMWAIKAITEEEEPK